MNDSWIAFVDWNGLQDLVLETQHIGPFAMRRAKRDNTACFWVVLRPEHAEIISRLRLMGRCCAALELMEQLAIDVGRITSEESIPVWSAEKRDNSRRP